MIITPEIIKQAVNILENEGLVAFPTETVYGLGADASNENAVRKIFRAKGRPYDHPLIVHIGSLKQWDEWALDISPEAHALAKAFWPGPLTMVLKKQPHVLDVVSGAQKTIGIRMPRHPVAQTLLQSFGKGLAAPSANRFTHISPTTAAAVKEELTDKVDLVLDGGNCEVGLESTIVDMSGNQPIVLRPGIITAQAISAVLGVEVASLTKDGIDVQRAPGMHHLHYAPHTQTSLVAKEAIPATLNALTPHDLPVVFLVRSDKEFAHTHHIHWVKMPEDAATYGHDLYRTLRSLDSQGFKRIFIEAVPEGIEWEAIRDRLAKATVPRGG